MGIAVADLQGGPPRPPGSTVAGGPALNRLRRIRLKAWNLLCAPKVITGSGGMSQMGLLSGNQPCSVTLTTFPMGRLWCTLTDFDRKR